MNPLDDRQQNRNETVAAYVLGELTGEDRATFERRMAEDETLRREVEATRAALKDARAWLDEPPPGIERAEGLEAPALRPAAGAGGLGVPPKVAVPPPASGMGVAPKMDVATPSAPRHPRIIPLHPVLRRIATAAAIFVLGFGFGRAVDWGRSGGAGSPNLTAVQHPSDQLDHASQLAAPGQPAPVTRPTALSESATAPKSTTQPQPAESPRPATAPLPAAPIETAAAPSATAVGRVLAQAGSPRPITYSENGKLFVKTTLSGSGASALWVVDGRFRLDHGPNNQ